MTTILPTFRALLALVCLLSASGSLANVIDPVSVWFDADVRTGDYAGTTGSGFFTYDANAVQNGDEVLGPDSSFSDYGLLDFSLSILGQNFGIADDAERANFPQVEFFDFMPDFINFLVVDGSPTDISDPQVSALGIEFYVDSVTPTTGQYAYAVTVEAFVETRAIPEPGSLALFGAGIAAFAWRRGRTGGDQ
jgi:hypothetical protein